MIDVNLSGLDSDRILAHMDDIVIFSPSFEDHLRELRTYIHGVPFYLLSDQGSNVDGDVMRSVCGTLGIEKRRSSAYHCGGNGFAERNICSVEDMLRAVLIHQRLQQSNGVQS